MSYVLNSYLLTYLHSHIMACNTRPVVRVLVCCPVVVFYFASSHCDWCRCFYFTQWMKIMIRRKSLLVVSFARQMLLMNEWT